MLTKSQRDSWADWLESGILEQARGRWKDGNKFCCLAVLSEKVLHNYMYANYSIINDLGVDTNLFAEYNDYEEMSFPEIAKEVRKLKTVD